MLYLMLLSWKSSDVRVMDTSGAVSDSSSCGSSQRAQGVLAIKWVALYAKRFKADPDLIDASPDGSSPAKRSETKESQTNIRRRFTLKQQADSKMGMPKRGSHVSRWRYFGREVSRRRAESRLFL